MPFQALELSQFSLALLAIEQFPLLAANSIGADYVMLQVDLIHITVDHLEEYASVVSMNGNLNTISFYSDLLFLD